MLCVDIEHRIVSPRRDMHHSRIHAARDGIDKLAEQLLKLM